jgi:hypothetical protein
VLFADDRLPRGHSPEKMDWLRSGKLGSFRDFVPANWVRSAKLTSFGEIGFVPRIGFVSRNFHLWLRSAAIGFVPWIRRFDAVSS